MKNIFNLRNLAIFIASVIFVSCSKEKLFQVKSGDAVSISKIGPVYNYGGISGTLCPAPYYAALKVYNDAENFTTSCIADVNGKFKVADLIPGTYRITVVFILNMPPYIPGNPPVGEYRYFEITGIRVEPGITTELDDIILLPK